MSGINDEGLHAAASKTLAQSASQIYARSSTTSDGEAASLGYPDSHWRWLEHERIAARFIFSRCIFRSQPSQTFLGVDYGCGEALLLALEQGFSRPVVGLHASFFHDTSGAQPNLEHHGYQEGKDFILLPFEQPTHSKAVPHVQHKLAEFGAHTTFDVVLCHPPPMYFGCSQGKKILSNLIKLGKPGGTFLFTSAPCYAQNSERADTILVNGVHHGEPHGIFPSGCLVGTNFDVRNLVETPLGPLPQATVTSAARIAEMRRWTDAEEQGRITLASVGLDAANATFVHLGTGAEYHLPSADFPSHRLETNLPWFADPAFNGLVDLSTAWMEKAYFKLFQSHKEQAKHGFKVNVDNLDWQSVRKACEIATEVSIQASFYTGSGPLRHRSFIVPVEVLVSISL